jgi:hypothetical protein
MFTHITPDDVSGLSAADLAQRLVEHSSRRKSTPASTAHPTLVREDLPGYVSALLWDTKAAGGVAPRSAFVCGDIVQERDDNASNTLLSLSDSADVRFRFAKTRQRRLLAVLSSRCVSPTLRLSAVDATHFYWKDECSPRLRCGGPRQDALLVQKRILRWALGTFAKNPLLKNITMQTLEMTFPALLAFAPHEREELAKQAAEMLGRGTVIWYGGTLIRQFHDSASLLVFPLLSSREERGAATVLFALASVHQIMATQREEADRAARYLLETYSVRHVAHSAALTRSVLMVASVLATPHSSTTQSGITLQDIAQGYLALLMQAGGERLTFLISSIESNPPSKVSEVLSQVRELTRYALCCSERPLCRHASTAHGQDRAEEDANAFFADPTALRIDTNHLSSTLTAEVDTRLPVTTAVPSREYEARLRLLEWASRWWETDTAAVPAEAAVGETELKISAKMAAAALREPMEGDHALLAVIQHTRKRRRGDGVQLTSQAVQTALEEADVRLKRRTFLQLVDALALSHDRKSRIDAAQHFLEQHHVEELRIRCFTEALAALADK